MGERDLLFVYGTLMRGERASHMLSAERFVCEASTPPRYWLAHVAGSYPALVEGGTDAVPGEIHEVDVAIFQELDIYEDVPELYSRVRLDIGERRPWVYLFRREHAAAHPRIEGGDWRKR